MLKSSSETTSNSGEVLQGKVRSAPPTPRARSIIAMSSLRLGITPSISGGSQPPLRLKLQPNEPAGSRPLHAEVGLRSLHNHLCNPTGNSPTTAPSVLALCSVTITSLPSVTFGGIESVAVSAVSICVWPLGSFAESVTPSSELPSRFVTCKTPSPLHVLSLPAWTRSIAGVADDACFCEQPQRSKPDSRMVNVFFIKV